MKDINLAAIKKVVNCTPHVVNVYDSEGKVQLCAFPPSGLLPRLKQQTANVGSINIDGISVPVTETVFGETENLPAPEDGVILIVSALVATANPHRTDLVLVNEAVRDAEGKIIGCRSLGLA